MVDDGIELETLQEAREAIVAGKLKLPELKVPELPRKVVAKGNKLGGNKEVLGAEEPKTGSRIAIRGGMIGVTIGKGRKVTGVNNIPKVEAVLGRRLFGTFAALGKKGGKGGVVEGEKKKVAGDGPGKGSGDVVEVKVPMSVLQ